ncbi:MAG: hypothetical protein QW568_02430 [Candidatus Anstonellaceae archaeon]
MIVQASSAQQQKYFCLHQLIPDAGREKHTRHFRAFVLNRQEIAIFRQAEILSKCLISNLPVATELPPFLNNLPTKSGQYPVGSLAFDVSGSKALLWWYFSTPNRFATGGLGFYSALLSSQHLKSEGMTEFAVTSTKRLSARHFARIGIFEGRAYSCEQWLGALEKGVEISKKILAKRIGPHEQILPMAEGPI